jgi:SAM-dependent methyltransferase
MDVETEVAQHYIHSDLTETVLAAPRDAGRDLEALTTVDLAPIDEFHLGWHPQTVAFADQLALPPGTALLDVGSGVGGPARYFAEARGCIVTGIDLTPGFVDAAKELTERTGLADRARFVTGSALALPFADASFDAATLMHVGMNVADKATLFAEVHRVLRSGGIFGVYEVMRAGEGELPFPLPWADGPETSFVETPATYHALLSGAGFRVERERDRSAFVVELADRMAERVAREGPPKLGGHLLMGPTASTRMQGVIGCLRDGRLAPIEMIARAG